MQNKVLVSIIIPVYNIEQYLEECLASVIKQSYEKLQVIVIDDGSTDGTGKICDQYALKDSRIKVIHTKNQGASKARNIGLESVRGEYIVFVDGDDVIGGDYIESIVKNIDQYKFDLMLYLKFYVYGKENTLDKNNHNDMVVGCYHNYIDVLNKLGENRIGAWSVCQIVIKHELLEINKTTFLSQYIRAEDLDFLMRIIKHAKSIYICDACEYYYRINRDGSAMSGISKDKLLSELRVAYHYYLEYEKIARKWQLFMAQFYMDRLLQIADIRDKNERKDIIKEVNEHKKVFMETEFCNLHRMFKYLTKIFGIYYGARLTKRLLRLRFFLNP